MNESTEDHRLPRGLGWLGLALGISEIVAPRTVARLIGVSPNRRNRSLIRAVGVGMCSVALADTQRGRARAGGEQQVIAAVTVRCSPQDAYRFWRDLGNLPRFVEHVREVEVTGERQSRWIMSGPGGTEVTWQVEIVDDRPNELIEWRTASEEGQMLEHGGRVTFTRAPGNRGTEVRLTIRHQKPSGLLGRAVTRVADKGIEQVVESDLRRFKQLLETGEVVQSDASIHRGPHPAQPPRELSRSELGGGYR